MSKMNLPPVTGGYNISTINSNFTKLANALNNEVLYRDNPEGEPNQMENELDMNGKRVYNLPEPVGDSEPMRKQDAALIVTEVAQPVIDAAEAATAAANAANAAATLATESAVASLAVANEAKTLALDADAKANAAQLAGNAALVGVGVAQAAADAAQTTANSALALAGTANTAANNAQLSANSAQLSANVALDALTNKAASGINTDIIELNNVRKINGGGFGGRRNHLLNGGFDAWQLGTSFQVSGHLQKNADRWNYDYNGQIGTMIVSRATAATGPLAPTTPYSPKYLARLNMTVAPTGNTFQDFSSQMESVRTLAGRTVTISYYALSIGSPKPMIMKTEQYFGGGGTPSPPVFNTADVQMIGTTWARYSVTFFIESVSGKTLGLNGDDTLNVIFSLPINQTFDIYIGGVQIEEGTVATPFEERSPSETLSDCQRYLQTSYTNGMAPGTPTSEGVVTARRFTDASTCSIQLKQPMRMLPFITYYNPTTGAAGSWAGTGGDASVSTNTNGTKNISVLIPGGTAANMSGHYVAQDPYY